MGAQKNGAEGFGLCRGRDGADLRGGARGARLWRGNRRFPPAGRSTLWSAGTALRIAAACAPRRFMRFLVMPGSRRGGFARRGGSCAPLAREPEVSSGWALHVVERGHGITHCGGLCAAPVHTRCGARARHYALRRLVRRAGSYTLWSAGTAIRITAVCAPRRFMRVVERGRGNTHCGGLCSAGVYARCGAQPARSAASCAKRRARGRRYSLPFTSAAPIWNAFFISSGKTVSWRFFFASASKYQGQSVLL